MSTWSVWTCPYCNSDWLDDGVRRPVLFEDEGCPECIGDVEAEWGAIPEDEEDE